MCDWLKFCKLCTYHAVYILCPCYRKHFCPPCISLYKEIQIFVRIEILNTELRICNLLHEGILLYL